MTVEITRAVSKEKFEQGDLVFTDHSIGSISVILVDTTKDDGTFSGVNINGDKVGEHESGWLNSCFKKFRGEIKLSQ